MNFVEALKIAEGVFEQYRKDQPKWWKRMDGTPILNDVAVRMAEAFRDPEELPESLRDPIAVMERGRTLLNAHEEATQSAMREFLGWLSGDIPELHNVEVPRLAESWERYRAKIDEYPAENRN